MKEVMIAVSAVVAGIMAILAISFGLQFVGLAQYSFFAPRVRAVENQVFKQSEQYNDGMIRDLEGLQMEYMQADDNHKQALKAIILHRFSVYDENRLPYNLRSFYNDLRSGK